MKRLFYLLAIALLAGGCDELFDPTLRPTPDPELGEDFKAMEHWIDMSKTNQFNESLLYNDWVLTKITQETYFDGVLTDTKDVTSDRYGTKGYSIKANHTLRRLFSNSTLGIWLYSHNYFMWKVGGGYYGEEVVKLTANVLCLKEESYPAGGAFSPYFVDKSGKHLFYIYEYIPWNGEK